MGKNDAHMCGLTRSVKDWVDEFSRAVEQLLRWEYNCHTAEACVEYLLHNLTSSE